MENGFKVTVKEVEPIENDLNKVNAEIEKRIPHALGIVASEMLDDLELHLKDDWYSMYHPHVYERRTDNPELGTSIMDESNVHMSVVGKKMEFTYSPTGQHANPYWSQRSGDTLIEFIQNGLWFKGSVSNDDVKIVPPRPFWNNFVREQFDYKIMQNFTAGMSPEFTVISEGGIKDIQQESMESLLDAGTIK